VSGLLVGRDDFPSSIVQLIGSVGWQKILADGAAGRVDRYFRLRHVVAGVRAVHEEVTNAR